MRELGDMDGFRIGGTVVNNLRYADDTVIVNYSYMPYRRPREYYGKVWSFIYLVCFPQMQDVKKILEGELV